MVRLFFLWTILISFASNAASNVDAFIEFSQPINEDEISHVEITNPSTEAYTEKATIGGMDCLFIPSTKYAYFRVDDTVIPTTENNLVFNITYYDQGSSDFRIQYNAVSNRYASIRISKTNTNEWITTTIAVSNAAFANLQNQQADLRIHGVSDTYIRRFEILKKAMDPSLEPITITQGSSYSEFIGKSVAGYQIWFKASDTNSGWVHWGGNPPSVGNMTFEIYPDMNEYTEDQKYATGFANLGNGEPATLFHSPDVIDTHFDWMVKTGIDGVAVQRFIGDAPYPITTSSQAKLLKVKNAAERTQKIFYVCYDMSSGKDENAWIESIKYDWVYNIEKNYALTSSPAYATVNNKPVVQIWGPGFDTRVGNAEGTIELINFLKNRGCYVIGGVPTNWRTESRDSKPNFLEAYKTYDMVSPWSAGRYRSVAAVDNHTEDYWVPDNNFCKANNMDYMPCVFPGFAWSTWKGGKPNSIPRENGEFLWRQAYKIKEAGMDQVYFGMFDEYDEGTNIMNGATDWTQIPTDQYFLTQSADGMWLSSDFYLRLSGEATEMLKSSGAPYETFKIDYSEGPVYYRNSFEKRLTTFDSDNDGTFESTGEYNIDPCFHNPDFISNSNVSSAKFEIEKMESNAKSGLYYAKATGTPTSSISASSYFKMADVKIPVEENMQIAYWKNTVNTLGRYVNIDLIFESGKKLSQLPNYINNKGKSMAASKGIGTTGAGWEYIICKLGEGELLGDTITGIVIAYDKPYPSDEFKAYFDDIIISTDLEAYNPDTSIKNYKTFSKIIVKGSRLDFSQFPLDSKINIYNLTGCSVSNFQLKNPIVNTNLPHGVYIVSILNYNGNYSQKIIL